MKYSDPSGHCPAPSSNGYSGSSTNIICVAMFIPTKYSSVPLFPDFVGDDRGFSSDSDPSASRAWAWIDADTGEIIESYVHVTCNTLGQCAGPIDDHGLYQNQITSELTEEGHIKFSYSILCAGLRCSVAPGPDGEMTFVRQSDGTFLSKGEINAFPNVEAYFHPSVGGKSENRPQTIFTFQSVTEDELESGIVNFGTSTAGMLGINTYSWDQTSPLPRPNNHGPY